MLKVLVVDDDKGIVKDTVKLLRLEGWEASGVISGEEALKNLDPSYDAVVLDLKMPGMDGESVFAEIRTRPELSRLCIVVLTAYGDVEGAVRMIRQGAYQYLQKATYDARDLARILSSGIAWQRAHALRRGILASLDQEVLIRRVHSIIAEAVQPEGLYIILLDPEGRVTGGDPPDAVRACDVKKRFVRHVMESKQPLFECADASEWDPVIPNARSLLAVPIPGAHGKTAGVIDVESCLNSAFDRNWIAVLEYLADLTGIGLDIAQEVERQFRGLQCVVDELSHHISTPLQVIKLQVETLTSKELKSEVPKAVAGRILERLEAIQRNADAIAQLRDYLRDISRDLQIHKVRFDLFQVLDASCREIESELTEKHIKTMVTGRPAEGLAVEADPNLIRYSLQCLLQNAIEAIDARRKRDGSAGTAASDRINITIQCPDPERVSVVIQDTGVGIAPENRKRLFEPLFTTKTPGERGGMGLFSVRRVLNLQGGSILEDSNPGQGARFVVTLPRK